MKQQPAIGPALEICDTGTKDLTQKKGS